MLPNGRSHLTTYSACSLWGNLVVFSLFLLLQYFVFFFFNVRVFFSFSRFNSLSTFTCFFFLLLFLFVFFSPFIQFEWIELAPIAATLLMMMMIWCFSGLLFVFVSGKYLLPFIHVLLRVSSSKSKSNAKTNEFTYFRIHRKYDGEISNIHQN